jgi:dihydrofolate reductase / thymidylate synthase
VRPIALTPPELACVVAADRRLGIGKANQLPWPRLPADVAHFKRITTETRDPARRNAVIMGRRTWDSLPPRFRPLDGRLNLIVSRGRPELPDDVILAASLDDALARATTAGIESIFVVGGAQIYAAAVADPRCRVVYLTRIDATYDTDAHFPALDAGFRLDAEDPPCTDAAVGYRIQRWVRA